MTDTPQVLLAHHLKTLKLPTFLREYDKLARQCATEGADHVRYLVRLTELELIDRERRMVERRIRQAKFPAVKSLDSFDFKAIPSLNKMLVLELARCEYVERRENIIALGNSGTGKTHIALGLGLAACQKGLSVGFLTAAALGATMLTLWALHVFGPTMAIIYKWIVAFKRDPLRLLLVRKAYRATGNGIHIAKLIQKARSVETARDILDIFDGSPGKERVADAYASYAQALVRFGYNIEAEAILRNLDDDQDISDIEIAEAMDRFLYPKDDGETVEDFADRLRKEPN